MSTEKIFVSVGLILCLTLLMNTNAIDLSPINPITELNKQGKQGYFGDVIHAMSKRRFLPTRREMSQILDGENSSDEFHSKTKRYFLKSKRYFLNSKRDNN